jgi:transposase
VAKLHRAALFDMKRSPQAAQGPIREWIAEVKHSGFDCFDKFITALEEVWGSLPTTSPVAPTAAPAEGMNNKIKALKRHYYWIANPISLSRRVWLDFCGYEAFAD